MKDQKNYQQEINELNNRVLSQETENFSPNRSVKGESAKKRLRNQIAKKDEIICDLKIDIETLNNDYKNLSDKWAYTDKQMKSQINRVQDLEGVVMDLESELQQKLEIIENLQVEMEELERHISQTREAKPKEVLDSSGDLLNFSFNQDSNVNCFTDETESENMGIIIDMKLKEVEHENNELRNEINRHNQVFTSQIKDFLLKLNPEDGVNDAVTLEEHIQAMVAAHAELDRKHSELNSNFKQIEMCLETKVHELVDVKNDRDSLSCELKSVRIDLENVVQCKTETLDKLSEMKELCNDLKRSLEDSNKAHQDVKVKHDDLTYILEQETERSGQLETELREKIAQIEVLQKEISQGLDRESDLNKMHQILEDDYKHMSESCEKLKAKIVAYSKEGHKLNERLKDAEKRLKESNGFQETLCAEVEQLKQEMALKEDRCTKIEADLKQAEDKVKVSTNVINELKNNITEKEAKLVEVTEAMEHIKLKAKTDTESLTSEIDATKKEFEKLTLQLSEVRNELDANAEKYDKEKECLTGKDGKQIGTNICQISNKHQTNS